MTRQKDLKRLVRARMEKTGESYTAARAQLLKKPVRVRVSAPPRTAAEPTPPPVDLAALAGMADDKVQMKTGRTWREWVAVLDSHDAWKLAHPDIARLLSGTYRTPDWWTQTVTVGYERIKGLRVKGQRRDGTHEANKSRTFHVAAGPLFDAFASAALKRWLGDSGVSIRTSKRPKYLRLGFADGTIAVIGFTPKGARKTLLSVQHTKLPDRTAAEGLKRYWVAKLDALEGLVAGG